MYLLVTVDFDIELGKRANVDEPQSMTLALFQVKPRQMCGRAVALVARVHSGTVDNIQAIDERAIGYRFSVLIIRRQIRWQKRGREIVVMVMQHHDLVAVILNVRHLHGRVYNEWPKKPVHTLGREVCVVPVRPVLVLHGKLVPERGARGYGTVCHTSGTVHEVGPVLVLPVPVQGRAVGARIVHVDHKRITFVAFQKGARELSVYYDEGSGYTWSWGQR